MTIEEAVALLREARTAIGDYDCWDCGMLDEPVWARIDAALEGHPAKPAPIGLKWEEKDSNRHGISPHQADYSDDVFLTAEPHWLNGEWLWRVERAGYAKDEADAKAKAIEYAGRLP
jgi:hypothetical protein